MQEERVCPFASLGARAGGGETLRSSIVRSSRPDSLRRSTGCTTTTAKAARRAAALAAVALASLTPKAALAARRPVATFAARRSGGAAGRGGLLERVGHLVSRQVQVFPEVPASQHGMARQPTRIVMSVVAL